MKRNCTTIKASNRELFNKLHVGHIPRHCFDKLSFYFFNFSRIFKNDWFYVEILKHTVFLYCIYNLLKRNGSSVTSKTKRFQVNNLLVDRRIGISLSYKLLIAFHFGLFTEIGLHLPNYTKSLRNVIAIE